jgi:nucleoside diphosphate kinase
MDRNTLTKLAAVVVAGGISLEYLRRRTSLAGGVESSSKTNAAFVFVKPHACNDAVVSLVRKTFAEKGIRVTSERKINGAEIDSRSLIDNHYGAIAAKALKIEPADLNVPAKGKAQFEQMFGLTWDDALAAGRVYNAKQACEKLGIDGDGLDALWAKTKKGVDSVKFGGGFYCALINDIFIMNGFYMSMRGGYCTPSANIHTFTVEWPSSALSWADFRGRVLGGTDPSAASVGSLRKQIFDDWEALGLSYEPNTGDNGLHASASPFEGLAERLNWCGATVSTDVFGSELLRAGVPESSVLAWTQDPQATLNGETGSLFDHLEDQNAEENIANCVIME